MHLDSRSSWASFPVQLFVYGIAIAIGLSSLGVADEPAGGARPPVDFTRDVQPVFATHCLACHGEKKQGGLRLNSRAAARRGGDHGPVLKRDRDGNIPLMARITSADPELRMPRDADPLSPEEIAILARWVASGAEWPDSAAGDSGPVHWSFQPPQKPAPPAVQAESWVRQPLDRFILARLEAQGLRPAPEADRYTLIRRLSLDLIGLPPTPAEVDAFVHDERSDAYEIVVDRLLNSPHYGERWARRWLDLARYSDTNGYEKDRPRKIWLYRDWVIQALNDDMPFDQFTIEQLAGDMLPGATLSQRIATGFHRNTMINEEGGIDPEEDRFKRIVDRIGTTGATWLGLTLGCAQCHSHKYDPISQQEFYELFAIFNQADELELPVPDASTTASRASLEERIAQVEADYPNRYPLPATLAWRDVQSVECRSTASTTLTPQADQSIIASGASPETDVYTLVIDTSAEEITALRLEALTDASLPGGGPGRAENGNFVLSELEVTAAPLGTSEAEVPIKFRSVQADFSQESFGIAQAIDGDKTSPTGWAIFSPSGAWNVARTATFELETPLRGKSGFRLTVNIHQQHGRCHLLGRFRLSVGQPHRDDRSIDVQRREHFERRFAQWQSDAAKQARRWTVLTPDQFRSNAATLTLLDDASVLATGDATKRDVFELEFTPQVERITAVRLEALPHPLLPGGGPGREVIDAPGDFFLSTIAVRAGAGDGSPLERATLHRAAHSFARPGATSERAIDDDEQTAWSISGGTGRAQMGVFELQTPIPGNMARKLEIVLTHAMYYPGSVGRFRLSVTGDPTPAAVPTFPSEIEEILLVPAAEQSPEQQEKLRRYYLAVAPEMASAHAEVASLKGQMPAYMTTMVMHERLPRHGRTTRLHHRGEFLKPQGAVEAGVPEALHAGSDEAPRDRLSFARWLVDRRNPLVARVTMNRHWAALFGKGIVRTVDDFGTQGEAPTHADLLDWLATEFMDRGWSQKAMHRLIVTSAVYRQSSQASPELLERDPSNLLLARAPRFRVDAELVRDVALFSAGLLNPKLAGPSVFSPQPEGITSSAFGALSWNTESGENRYRRGLYTFSKRTAPYAAFTAFDAPTGDFCTVRRERSNTPLQALTLMNDLVFVEAAQAMARRARTSLPDDLAGQLSLMFRFCLSRPPTPAELHQMRGYLSEQLARFRSGELNPALVAGGTLRKWNFESAADGWDSKEGSRLENVEGNLRVTNGEKGPAISTATEIPAGRMVLRMRARFANGGHVKVSWLGRGEQKPGDSSSVTFGTIANAWNEYSTEVNPREEIVGLQLDLGSTPGTVEIDRIELCAGLLPPMSDDLPELAAMTALARVLLNLDSTITRE